MAVGKHINWFIGGFAALLLLVAVYCFTAQPDWVRGRGGAETQQGGPRIQEKFLEHCASCHGPKGNGDGGTARLLGLKMESFQNCESMNRFPDGVLFSIIKNGAASFGRSAAMPGWSRVLSDGEVREMVRYVRGFCAGEASSAPP